MPRCLKGMKVDKGRERRSLDQVFGWVSSIIVLLRIYREVSLATKIGEIRREKFARCGVGGEGR